MSGFKPYPAYKNSGSNRLGDVPAHWEVVPCRVIVDECVEKNSLGKITEYLSLMANIGIIRYEDKGDVGNKKPDDLSKCKIVKKGDLVINSMNYGIGSYGLSPLDGICSPVYIVLDPRDDVIQERFALRIFEEKEFQAFAQSFGNGILAHRSAIGWDDLKNILVALPPLAEQTLLSNFLDHETARIDALIEEQQRLIELLKEKRQAVISHAVTKGLDPTVPMKDSGVEWLGEVPAHWDVVSLKRVVVFQRGHDLPSESREEGNVPVISSGGYSGTHSVACAKAPGIVTGRYGSIGQFTLATEDYWPLNTALYSIELYGNKPRYVWYLLQGYAEHFLLNSLKSAVPGVDRNDVHVVKVVAAPVEEQDQIITYIDRISNQLDQLVEAAEKNVTLLQERRSALISAAVTGKIDVRNW